MTTVRKKKWNADYHRKQHIILKLKAIKYLGGKCCSCGYNKYYGALEFHHRDPSEKDVEWNKLRRRSWDNITKELDKCQLLCANCHREEHRDESLLIEAIRWRNEIDNKKIEVIKCDFCNKEFKPRTNSIKHCCKYCADQSRCKIEWPDNLKELVDKSSKRAVASKLGVSDKAVAKRLIKYI